MSDYDYLDKGIRGTVFGQSSSSLIGFWTTQPVDQPDALTAAVSTITYATATAPTSIIIMTAVSTASGAGFVTTAQFGGACKAVQNAQTRIAELASRLVEAGIIAGGTAVTSSTATQFDIVGKGADEGTVLGQHTSSKVSFYGRTPCDQPAAVTTASAHPVLIITATISTTSIDATISVGVTGAYGFGTAETHNNSASFLGMIANVQTRLAEMETNLAEVGLIAGGTALTTSGDYDYLDKGCDSGTVMGYDSTALLGFWAATPCDQAAALTDAATTIAFVSAVEATFVMGTMKVGTSTFKFISVTAGETLIFAVQNAQTRLNEIEAALNACGLQAT